MGKERRGPSDKKEKAGEQISEDIGERLSIFNISWIFIFQLHGSVGMLGR